MKLAQENLYYEVRESTSISPLVSQATCPVWLMPFSTLLYWHSFYTNSNFSYLFFLSYPYTCTGLTFDQRKPWQLVGNMDLTHSDIW